MYVSQQKASRKALRRKAGGNRNSSKKSIKEQELNMASAKEPLIKARYCRSLLPCDKGSGEFSEDNEKQTPAIARPDQGVSATVEQRQY